MKLFHQSQAFYSQAHSGPQQPLNMIGSLISKCGFDWPVISMSAPHQSMNIVILVGLQVIIKILRPIP